MNRGTMDVLIIAEGQGTRFWACLQGKNIIFERRHISTRETFHRFEMTKDRLADNPVA